MNVFDYNAPGAFWGKNSYKVDELILGSYLNFWRGRHR